MGTVKDAIKNFTLGAFWAAGCFVGIVAVEKVKDRIDERKRKKNKS